MATFYKVDFFDMIEAVNGTPAKAYQRASFDTDKIGNYNMPAGWGGSGPSVGGVIVKPGYNLCLYDGENQTLDRASGPLCLGPGRAYVGNHILKKLDSRRYITWANVKSYKLRKECSEPQWMWDEDCKYIDSNRVIGSCADKDSACHKNRLVHCNTEAGLTDPNCPLYCADNHGECDNLMMKYCGLPENKDADVCSCIKSPASKYNPLCIDSRCIRTGYTTKTMLDKPCADVIDCGVYYDIKDTAGNVDFADVNISQRCQAETQAETEAALEQKQKQAAEKQAKVLQMREENHKETVARLNAETEDASSWIKRIIYALIAICVCLLLGYKIYVWGVAVKVKNISSVVLPGVAK